jgi:hypothetical protein
MNRNTQRKCKKRTHLPYNILVGEDCCICPVRRAVSLLKIVHSLIHFESHRERMLQSKVKMSLLKYGCKIFTSSRRSKEFLTKSATPLCSRLAIVLLSILDICQSKASRAMKE